MGIKYMSKDSIRIKKNKLDKNDVVVISKKDIKRTHQHKTILHKHNINYNTKNIVKPVVQENKNVKEYENHHTESVHINIDDKIDKINMKIDNKINEINKKISTQENIQEKISFFKKIKKKLNNLFD